MHESTRTTGGRAGGRVRITNTSFRRTDIKVLPLEKCNKATDQGTEQMGFPGRIGWKYV